MIRQQVLMEDAETVAAKLRAKPGRWFVVAAGDRDRLRVMLTTAWRIREGKLAAFRTDQYGGTYYARTLTSPTREHRVGDVEIKAMWVPGY